MHPLSVWSEGSRGEMCYSGIHFSLSNQYTVRIIPDVNCAPAPFSVTRTHTFCTVTSSATACTMQSGARARFKWTCKFFVLSALTLHVSRQRNLFLNYGAMISAFIVMIHQINLLFREGQQTDKDNLSLRKPSQSAKSLLKPNDYPGSENINFSFSSKTKNDVKAKIL